MRVAHPNSLVVAAVLLVEALRTMIVQKHPHFVALHYLVLVLSPVGALCCGWHAFKGRRPLLSEREFYSSLQLAVYSLAVPVGTTFAWLVYHFHAPNAFPIVLFSAAGVFFIAQAIRDRQASSVEGASRGL